MKIVIELGFMEANYCRKELEKLMEKQIEYYKKGLNKTQKSEIEIESILNRDREKKGAKR